MRLTWRHCMACLIAGLLFIQAPSAKPPAQLDRGSISGVVRDSASGAVAAAKVTALLDGSPAPGKGYEVMTDDEGAFRFDNLPAGVYEVRASAEPYIFKPEARPGIRVRKARNTEVNFRLESVRACDDSSASGAGNVVDSDKAEIVRLTLEAALVEKNIPDYNLLVEGKEKVVLSAKNIKPGWVPDLPGYNLVLMKPAEIQAAANSGGDFLYLSFDEFKVRGGCVAVTLSNSWAVGKNSGMGYLSGGGFTYEYRKQSGRWVGKGISGWIS